MIVLHIQANGRQVTTPLANNSQEHHWISHLFLGCFAGKSGEIERRQNVTNT